MRPAPSRSKGFAAATALFAISLFVLLGAVAAISSRSLAKAKQFQETKDQIVAQRDLIWNMLLLCRTLFPAGDNGTTFHVQYPATPTDGLVSSIACPGQGATGTVWSGDERTMAPRALPGFGAWRYTNDATSIRISIAANDSGVVYYQDLMDAVIRRLGAGQASRSTDTLTITLIN